MAVVARLLPRHWDGRRLLQFLTGLALIAMAFAVPSLAPPAEPDTPPARFITTVDAPTGPESAPGDPETAGADPEIVVVTPAEIDIVADSLAGARPAGFGPTAVGPAAFGHTGFRPARPATVGQVEATAGQFETIARHADVTAGQFKAGQVEAGQVEAGQLDGRWSGVGWSGSGTLVCSTARPAHQGVRPCAYGERGPPVG